MISNIFYMKYTFLGVNIMKNSKGKYAWTVRVGEKGRINFPKEARDVFDINPGDTLLLLGDEQKGIVIVNRDEFDDLISQILEAQDYEDFFDDSYSSNRSYKNI